MVQKHFYGRTSFRQPTSQILHSLNFDSNLVSEKRDNSGQSSLILVLQTAFQLPGNAIVSQPVFSCHPDDQFGDFLTNWVPSQVGAVFETIELAGN
jgi:hypothetical protein